jgi:DNA topoisomerase-1
MEDRQYNHVERALGNDPKDGKPLMARYGQYGPYVQKGEGEDRQFARLAPGQLIESITLEEALKLFELPRTVGEYEGTPIVATKGRFGPYLKYGDRNISLPRGKDPMKVSLEECIALIDADPGKSGAPAVVHEYGDIQVINGRYGLYIKHDGSNYRIPRGTKAEELSEQRCREIIAAEQPTGGKNRRKK